MSSELIAAIKSPSGELIATGKTTSKEDRLTFQNWVRRGISSGDLDFDQMVKIYLSLGGGRIATLYPFEEYGWIEGGAYYVPSDAPHLKIVTGKFLWYDEMHRFILISTPYTYNGPEIMRVDTHFYRGRIYFPRQIGKEDILKLFDTWVDRSRSKTFCWAMALLFGAYYLLQRNSKGDEKKFPREEE
jgi:hypothetical protein